MSSTWGSIRAIGRTMRGRTLAGAIMLGAMTLPAQVMAQEKAPPVAPAGGDIVFLENGGLYRGRLTEIVPGDHVTVQVEGGDAKTIPWAEIERIVAANGPAAAPSILRPDGAREEPTRPAQAPPPTETPARLDTPPAEEGPQKPQTQWQANRTLLTAGAIMFGAGYGPNVIAAVPSTVGLAGRVVLLILTIGLPCWFGGNGEYICDGQHGAVQLLIPIAGPFLFAADHPRDTILNRPGSPLPDHTKALLYASGGLQIAGIASILTAVAVGKQEPVPQRKASSPSFFVFPQAGGADLGLTVGFSRW